MISRKMRTQDQMHSLRLNADLGYLEKMHELGVVLTENLYPAKGWADRVWNRHSNFWEGMDWLRKAVEDGSPEAKLDYALQLSETMSEPPETTYSYFLQAAKAKVIKADVALVQYFVARFVPNDHNADWGVEKIDMEKLEQVLPILINELRINARTVEEEAWILKDALAKEIGDLDRSKNGHAQADMKRQTEILGEIVARLYTDSDQHIHLTQ